MRKYLIGLIALFALVAVTPASAAVGGFFTGNDTMVDCKDTGSGEGGVNVSKYNECVVYLAGISDAAEVFSSLEGTRLKICAPNGTSVEQLRQVFLNFMNARPEKWNLSAAFLALTAFANAWPCKE